MASRIQIENYDKCSSDKVWKSLAETFTFVDFDKNSYADFDEATEFSCLDHKPSAAIENIKKIFRSTTESGEFFSIYSFHFGLSLFYFVEPFVIGCNNKSGELRMGPGLLSDV